MAITFDRVPTANRVPGAYAEIDGSRALSAQPGDLHRVLIIGLMQAGGTATAGVPVLIEGAADQLFGARSQLAAMVQAFRKLNQNARVYALPLAEAGGAVAATRTLTIAGTATAPGSLTVRIGDRRITIAVTPDMAVAAIATALAAAINAEVRIDATAAAAAGVVTLTAVHAGELGNAIVAESVLVPAGLTVTAAAGTVGATNPSTAAALAALGDDRYDTFCTGLTDAVNLGFLEAEVARRWEPLVKMPGHAIAAVRGTLGAMVGIGNARNSQHLTIVGAGLSPTPPWIWAAQVAARDAEQTDLQPNRPRNGLTLPDCEAPLSAHRLDSAERNQLLYDGISTHKVDAGGRVLIERLITTYQQTAGGSSDATYLALETMRNLADFYLAVIALGARHERDLVGPNGTAVAPGVPMVTPAMMRGELGALYRVRERRGLVTDTDGFMRELVVEIPETDKERINAHLVPRLVNGLVTQAFKLSFTL